MSVGIARRLYPVGFSAGRATITKRCLTKVRSKLIKCGSSRERPIRDHTPSTARILSRRDLSPISAFYRNTCNLLSAIVLSDRSEFASRSTPWMNRGMPFHSG